MQSKFIVNGKEQNNTTPKNNKLKELYRYISTNCDDNGKIPLISLIEQNLNLQKYELIELLKKLEENKLIIRKNNNYYISKKTPKKEKIINKKIEKKKIDIPYKTNMIIIFKIFCTIIGFITFYISILYSFKWFTNLLNFFNSLLFSIAIVGFLLISFELMIFFANKKKYIISFLFVFLWLITTLFSMSSTLAGQQKEMMLKNINDYDIQNSNKILILKEIDNRIKEIQIDIKSKRKERTKLLEFLNSIDNFEENKKQYNSINYRIYLKNKALEEMDIKIKELKDKKINMLNEGLNLKKEKEIDFFKWLENIFNIKDYVFQFWLYLFPSLFIDLICPICFSIVFFLKENDKEQQIIQNK